MLRAIVVVGFLLGLISAAVFGSRWLQTSGNDAPETNQPACDLLAGPCEWETEAGLWQVDLHVMGGEEQGIEYQLTVQAPTAPERFLAVLRGESMYMGEYPVPLRKEEDGQYSAHFTAPLCITGSEMAWRVDLQKGQQPLSETVPLKLVFQARDHSSR
ncbi:hypothetical protein SAMN04488490_0963 [Marinobacter sp. LV10R510-11A]|uniref:hypothetical protein n=1 Tax=Marinobacter sp. LV10R510-11A TaxID=1415568 RepID=UPI000BB7BB20|nr:hypothetical protein [Marinobacter sp. LV10R510-11A]SOB75379.1 hypothetical protein SAMN04488490_0963 [Marinobacter sp. LV10R510-11A]